MRNVDNNTFTPLRPFNMRNVITLHLRPFNMRNVDNNTFTPF